MGFEGGFRFESSRRVVSEAEDLSRHPEQVVDSPLNFAGKENERVQSLLDTNNRLHVTTRNAELAYSKKERGSTSTSPVIRISWPIRGNRAWALELRGISKGQGPESNGVDGYAGNYGIIERGQDSESFVESQSIESLFNFPQNVRVMVKPTVARWAIGQDELAEHYGENVQTLFMGLGLLLVNHQFMLIGMHEAGHLLAKNIDSEMEAWKIGLNNYKKRHKDRKEGILSGKDTGLFELLQEPSHDRPIIGDIVKPSFLFTSDSGDWGTERKIDILNKWDRIVQRAEDAFERLER